MASPREHAANHTRPPDQQPLPCPYAPPWPLHGRLSDPCCEYCLAPPPPRGGRGKKKKSLSKVTVGFLFVPRKKAWERRCAWPQALKRWPRRLFAIKLRINDGFGMFFRCILTTRQHFIHLLSRFLFGAPMGATRHEHQTFHSRMHGKDGATGQFILSLKKIFFRPQLPPSPTSSVSFHGRTGKECWALLTQCFQLFF